MAKKFFVLAALVTALAAPAAFAHGGQEGVVGPQPVEWTGEEVTLTGLLEPAGEKLDGTPVWMMEDEGSGSLYHVEQGKGVDLSAFEGQRVYLHGALGYLEGAVILVDSAEPLEGETEGLPSAESSGTGEVEYLGDRMDGTPVYGLSVSPEEGHAMEGGLDFDAFEGQRVAVTGRFAHYRGGFSYLQVQSIEPADEKEADDVQATKETGPVAAVSPEMPAPAAENAQETVPAASPGTTEPAADAAKEIVAVELASGGSPLAVASDVGEPGVFSTAVKALPVTGGTAFLLPLAGLVLAAAGLVAFRMTR